MWVRFRYKLALCILTEAEIKIIREGIAALSLANDPNGVFEALICFPLTTQSAVPLYQRFQLIGSHHITALDAVCAIMWHGPVPVIHLLSSDRTGTQGDGGADGNFSPLFGRRSEVWYLLSS